MRLMVFLVAFFIVWLSLNALMIALNRKQPLNIVNILNRQWFAILSVSLALMSLYFLHQYLPILQSIFTWLGMMSLCGIGTVVTNPNSRRNSGKNVHRLN